MEDFFGSKNTMNFCGVATMSLGTVIKPDDTYEEAVEIKGKDYKKIIHKNGTIYGAIVQGDLSYVGVLTQLIKDKINIGFVAEMHNRNNRENPELTKMAAILIDAKRKGTSLEDVKDMLEHSDKINNRERELLAKFYEKAR